MASITGHSAKTSAGASHQNAKHIPRSPNAPDPNNVPLSNTYYHLGGWLEGEHPAFALQGDD
jgi:hypothetical protein